MKNLNPLRDLVTRTADIPTLIDADPAIEFITRATENLLAADPTPESLAKHLEEEAQHAAQTTIRLRTHGDATWMSLPYTKPNGEPIQVRIVTVHGRPDIVVVTDDGSIPNAISTDAMRPLERAGFRRMASLWIAPVHVESFGFRVLELGQALAESMASTHAIRNQEQDQPSVSQ